MYRLQYNFSAEGITECMGNDEISELIDNDIVEKVTKVTEG